MRLDQNKLHHAYCIPGTGTVLPELFEALLRDVRFSAKGNPDFWLGEYETFGIDESRFLKEASAERPVAGERKVYVVVAESITREAQNALLKIFEEPAGDTLFFIIVPSEESLIQTLRSRMAFLRLEGNREAMYVKEARAFISAALPERLKMVAAFLKKTEEEGRGRRAAFLIGLTRELSRAPFAKEKETADALSDLLTSARYARGRSPSWKLLLEHLALVLPQV